MAFPLSQGRVRDGKLLCTLHHWEFPLEGDEAQVAPEHRLVHYPVRLRADGIVEVDASAL